MQASMNAKRDGLHLLQLDYNDASLYSICICICICSSLPLACMACRIASVLWAHCVHRLHSKPVAGGQEEGLCLHSPGGGLFRVQW